MGDLASKEPDLLLEGEMRLCFITILLACVVAQGAIHSYEESTEVVEDKSEVDELLQEDAEKGHKNCPQREEEATKLLKAYQAARLLHRQSPRYGVQDETTTQLLTAWGALYKSARAKYVFYCTQTKQDLDDIANAVKKKEVVAVENAAQAGLMAAQVAMKQKRAAAEKAHKSVVRRAYAEKKEKRDRKKRAQEKTEKMAQTAIAKNIERLRKLPSITRHLYGKVRDANTGKATLSGAISGPIGRQCDMHVSKKGYAPSKTPITVARVNTDSIYSEAMMLPEIADKKRFRFVLQYGSMPPNLDAHIMVPVRGSYVDVAENKLGGGGDNVKFGGSGASHSSPYVTLDHTARRFGPETLSIHTIQDGVYHFLVVNAAQSFTDARQFQASHARGFLYQGNQLVETVAINSARGSPTQMWYVLALSCKGGECSANRQNRFVERNPA